MLPLCGLVALKASKSNDVDAMHVDGSSVKSPLKKSCIYLLLLLVEPLGKILPELISCLQNAIFRVTLGIHGVASASKCTRFCQTIDKQL